MSKEDTIAAAVAAKEIVLFTWNEATIPTFYLQELPANMQDDNTANYKILVYSGCNPAQPLLVGDGATVTVRCRLGSDPFTMLSVVPNE